MAWRTGARTRGSAWRGARMYSATLLVALGLALAACSSGGPSGANSTPAPTIPAGQTTASTTTGPGGPQSSPTTAGVAGSGSLDICQPVTPTPVQIGVPSEIPVYPTGDLKLAESSPSTHASEFGFCIPDTVSAVGSFYTQQLPGKGWGNMNTFTNLGTENITATRGSESVTITVSPDTLQQGNTDLLIILQGS